jgi:hypothetical protein
VAEVVAGGTFGRDDVDGVGREVLHIRDIDRRQGNLFSAYIETSTTADTRESKKVKNLGSIFRNFLSAEFLQKLCIKTLLKMRKLRKIDTCFDRNLRTNQIDKKGIM